MPAPTSLAFCGAGFISVVHGLAARHLGLPVVAVASRTRQRAEERARELGARAVRSDELPAGADIVVVSTPPPRHAADALAALRAGAAVVVEKPLCTTLADADRLVAAGGTRLLYAENLAAAPVVCRFVDLAATLGPLTHLEARTVQALPTWGEFTTEAWGGGALFDLGVHPLAVVLLAARPARPVAVRCRLDGSGAHPTDEHAEVALTFDTGLVARVVSSWRGGAVPQWDAQAASATGVVRAELFPLLSLERDGEEIALPRARTQPPQLEDFGYTGQLAGFVADLDAGRAPLMDAAFGRHVLDVVCAAYRSAGRGGAPEPLPFTGPRDRTPLQLWRGG